MSSIKWFVVQCNNLDCSKYMVTREGTKRKKCPYCNKSFKVNDNFIRSFLNQEDARKFLKKMNMRI